MLNIHLNPELDISERFDTLMSPSGTVATLNQIAQENGIEHHGFDEGFPAKEMVRRAIKEAVVSEIRSRGRAILNFSILLYNAKSTIEFIAELKHEFGCRIVTVVGGQLVPAAKEAYLKNRDVDVVAIGDGEILLPQIHSAVANGFQRRLYHGPEFWLQNDPNRQGQFAFTSYDNFYGIRERLETQRKYSPPSISTGNSRIRWARLFVGQKE